MQKFPREMEIPPEMEKNEKLISKGLIK